MIGGDPNDLDPERPNGVVTLGISCLRTVISMSGAVDLDREQEGGTVEVEYEDRDRFLPSELQAQALLAP